MTRAYQTSPGSSTAAAAVPAAAPPPLRLLAMEVRALGEFARLAVMRRALRQAPPGDGHPVLVLPGLMSSDWASLPMRRFLSGLGYAAHGWGFGVNRGPRGTLEADLAALLAALADRHGRKVSLVGTSLGGIYARQLAKAFPQLTRSVVTLGSPFAGSPRATRAWRIYERASGLAVDGCDEHMGGRLSLPPPVPTTAIYSRTDGICAWQCCVERQGPLSESVEVAGSHIGLPHNPLVFQILADRLAQPEGRFRPYRAEPSESLLRRALTRGGAATAEAPAGSAGAGLLPARAGARSGTR